MSSANEILQNVDQHSQLWVVIATLDSWGFTLSNTRISLWTTLVALGILLAVMLFARLSVRIASWSIGRITGFDMAQRLLAQKLVSIAVWTLAFLIAVDALGIDLTALAVFSGAFGLALGFGLQKTFGNLLAGIILLMDRSIKPGDVIAVNDGISNTVGQVKKIGIRAVSVTTRDKKEYLIPNENLMINQVENWSYSSREVRIRVPVTIAPNSDIEVAERLMLEAARASPRVIDNPAPTVWIIAFGEAGIAFEIRVWIVDPEEGIAPVRSDILKRLWHLFGEHGIKLPYRHQRELFFQDDAQFERLVDALSSHPEIPASADTPRHS